MLAKFFDPSISMSWLEVFERGDSWTSVQLLLIASSSCSSGACIPAIAAVASDDIVRILSKLGVSFCFLLPVVALGLYSLCMILLWPLTVGFLFFSVF